MRKYETPELEVTKFEVEQPIMDGEQGSDDIVNKTHVYESATTAEDGSFEFG